VIEIDGNRPAVGFAVRAKTKQILPRPSNAAQVDTKTCQQYRPSNKRSDKLTTVPITVPTNISRTYVKKFTLILVDKRPDHPYT